MKLGLITYPKPFEDDRGVVRIDGRHLQVVDLATLEPVENLAGMLWGQGSLLLGGSEEGLLTPEHVDANADYLILVVPCAAAENLDRPPER